jgi:hypothetical protein
MRTRIPASFPTGVQAGLPPAETAAPDPLVFGAGFFAAVFTFRAGRVAGFFDFLAFVAFLVVFALAAMI